MRLGIDFGTTRTVVAAVVDGRHPVAIFETPNGYSDFVPSSAMSCGGRLDFAWNAAHDGDAPADALLRSLKREAAARPPDEAVDGLGAEHTALGVVTRFLEFLRRSIVERSNLDVGPDEPLEAMVAVPANAPSSQRYLTLEAFRRAGFGVLGLINEPTAAAIEYARNNLSALGRRSPKRYVVVYDLGGGTFDTSAVSLVDRRFELIATEGIGRLGGEDFDAAILELSLRAAGRELESLGAVERGRLLELCREAKEGLTPASRRVLVDLPRLLPGTEPVTLDIADVNDACSPLVERTLELLSRVLDQVRAAGIDPDNPRELGGLYLVGGGTAFPLVGRRLRELYRRKVLLAPQPHAATAVGLAIAADPDAEILVREVVTRHFGVWRESDAGRSKVFDPILSKGVLPDENGVRVIRRYRPVHAVGHLRFLECSELGPAGEPSGDVTPWGDVFFPYDPSLAEAADLSRLAATPARAADEIVEEYGYARDGTISVCIENTSHGYRRSYVLQRGSAAPA